MSTWPTLTAEARARVIGYVAARGREEWRAGSLTPEEWAAIATVLETVDALGPVVADVAAWDWIHAEECAHGGCPDLECDGTDDDCEAKGRACDCSAGDVQALLDMVIPLVKAPVTVKP
jgi:hypothetical protein